MKKIYIFKGSSRGFKDYLDKIKVKQNLFISEIFKLDQITKTGFSIPLPQGYSESDIESALKTQLKLANGIVNNSENEDFVIYANDYKRLNEHFLYDFKSALNKILVNNLYIQNPPSFLEKILKTEYPNIFEPLPPEEHKNFDLQTLNSLKAKLKDKIIGQDESINRFLVNLNYYSATETKKPLVVLFYGSTGIGKTQTVQLLSDTLKENLFRKQMSMGYGNEAYTYFYGGKHNEKSFAKDLLERESNIILLDEFDKIEPSFYNAFYQFFDEGVYKDHNYSVKLENAIIVCTSNFSSESNIKKHLGEAIFSRFDDVIKYKNLTSASIELIIDKIIQDELGMLKGDYKKFSFENIKNNYFNDYKTKKSLKNAREVRSYVRYILGLEVEKLELLTTTSSSQPPNKQN
jgi:ATP-dependent Clp protease ATP-binding subunit ClpA